MEALHSFNLNKKDIPNYVIPLALFQAEIFWFCSALYCIFSKSRLYKNKYKLDRARVRSNSAPTSSKSTSPAPLPPPLSLSSSMSTCAKAQLETIKESMEEFNDKIYSIKELRRNSLPVSCIRQRPSIKDELNGTTCPPVWWQKTRVKLGYTPIHDDYKIESLTKSEKKILKDTITTIAHLALPTPSSSISSSPSSPIKPVFKHDIHSEDTPTEHFIEHIEFCRHTTHSSNSSSDNSDSSSSNSSIERKNKFVSKIRAVFHHKRNRN